MTHVSASAKSHRRVTPAMSLALALAWVLVWPSLASASIVVQNSMQGAVGQATEGPRYFSYSDALEVQFDTEVDFDQGTFDGTVVDGTGQFLQLALDDGDWWDLDWGARRCFDVINPGPMLDEYQVRVVFDSSADEAAGLVQTNGQDYRAVTEIGGAFVEVDLWYESGVGTAETIVWAQLDLAASSDTRFCLYFDNPVAMSVSSQADVFTYSTQRQLYYPLSFRFDGSAGAAGSLDVVSLVDNNNVTIDGVQQTMNAGDVRRFTNVQPGSTILSTGPIAGRGLVDGMDSIAPIRFAGTQAVFPTNRQTQRWSLVSPTGVPADVEIYNGTTLAWSGSVGATVVSPVADVSPGATGSVISTNGVPILVNHTSQQSRDAVVVPPFLGDDLFGVRSRHLLVGVLDAPGSFDIFRSDGTFTPVTNLAPGTIYQEIDNNDRDGDGTAVRITNMNRPTGALQQADADGWESTAFLPEGLLDNEYYLPTNAQYVAFACPTAATINVGAQQIPCAPLLADSPGHGVSTAAPAGTRIWSDNGEKFYAYYEDSANNDETNLFGMKVARAFSASEVVASALGLELTPGLGPVGTWVSPAIDTTTSASNVFGLLNLVADLPVDTSVRLQVARGATQALALIAPFEGPDGTSATWFDPGESMVPYAWDFGDQWVVLRVELATTDDQVTPLVDIVSLTYDLAEQQATSFHAVTSNGANPDSDYILRVWTEDGVMAGASATVAHLQNSGFSAASEMTMRIDTEPQVVIASGVLTQQTGVPVPVGPGTPRSIVAETSDAVGGQVIAVWQSRLGGSGIIVQHELTVAFG